MFQTLLATCLLAGRYGVELNKSITPEELFFDFGGNWLNFVRRSQWPGEVAWETRLNIAKYHLQDALHLKDLSGVTFLDAGCGSGLFSLAATRLGARVVSFDLQEGSIEAARLLWRQELQPAQWDILQGSVLDMSFLDSLPRADVVYAWGSLHHTGDAHTAVRNVATLLKPGGLLHMALYNSELESPLETSAWDDKKWAYTELQKAPHQSLDLMTNAYVFWQVRRTLNEVLQRGELLVGRPLTEFEEYDLINSKLSQLNSHHALARGMDLWTDARDALGGWPNHRLETMEVVDLAKEIGLVMMSVDFAASGGLTSFNLRRPEPSSVSGEPRLLSGYRLQIVCGPYVRLAEMRGCWSKLFPSWSDCAGSSSPLRLLEDGYFLGLSAGAYHKDGRFCSARGRYSHLKQGIAFMTSDFTDPNVNGRTYHVAVPNEWQDFDLCPREGGHVD